jgi:hypothetical protein
MPVSQFLIVPENVELKLSAKLAAFFSNDIAPPRTHKDLDKFPIDIRTEYADLLLKAFAKKPADFNSLSNASITLVTNYIYSKFTQGVKPFELKHMLYAGMLLRYYKHRDLDSQTSSKLYSIAGTIFDLKDFLKVKDTKFYAAPLEVAFANIMHTYSQCHAIWDKEKSGYHDKSMTAERVEILALSYCDGFIQLLKDLPRHANLLSFEFKEMLVSFLLSFPFRKHFKDLGMSDASINYIRQIFTHALIFIVGSSAQQEYSFMPAALREIERLLKANPHNVSRSCTRLLHNNKRGKYQGLIENETFVNNLMPILVRCMRTSDLDQTKLELLTRMQQSFSTAHKDVFSKLLSQDLLGFDYDERVLGWIYDLGLGLRDFEHIHSQILGVLHKFHANINEFVDQFKRPMSKEMAHGNLKDLYSQNNIGLRLICGLWNARAIMDLNPKVLRTLACLPLDSETFKIDQTKILELIRHVTIIARLSCNYNRETEAKHRVSIDARRDNLIIGLNNLLSNIVEPAQMVRVTVQSIFTHDSKTGMKWAKEINAIIHYVGANQWAFYDTNLQSPIIVKDKDSVKLVEYLLQHCKNEVPDFSVRFDLQNIELAQILITCYPRSHTSPLMFSGRHGTMTPIPRTDSSEELQISAGIRKTESSPQLQAMQYNKW